MVFFALVFAPFAVALASETVSLPEIIVEGKRLRGDHRSAVVLTRKEISREAGRPIGEMLRETAGVDFTEGTGGNSNVLIRGASGSQTLVLIDGVKANDPSVTNRYFDWSRIDTTQIERVEILKGPQAVSYGSDAIGGVILIRTRRGGIGKSALVEGGSEGFARVRGSFGTELDERHSVRFQLLGKARFAGRSSALGAPPWFVTEGDDSREGSLGAELDSDWSSAIRSRFSADLRAAREDIDGGAFDDDPNSVARNRELRNSFRLDGRASDTTDWSLLISRLDFRRAYSDFPDAGHVTSSDSVYHGGNTRVETQLRSVVFDRMEVVVGIEATRETLRIDSISSPVALSKDHADAIALFGEGALPIIGKGRLEGENKGARSLLSADFGTRFSQDSFARDYGSTGKWSGKFGLNSDPSDRLELDLGVATGFKSPSLYSLYEPTYGNRNLRPEESVQVEAGASYAASADLKLSGRVFQSRIRNRFGFDPASFQSTNTERAEIRGAEYEMEWKASERLRLCPTVTYLSTRDRRTGKPLADVPRWKGSAKLEWSMTPETSVTASMIAKSSRGSSAGSTKVAGFSRVDVAARHEISPRWSATARIENALDRDYQELRGFSSPGFSAYVGAEYRD